MRATPGLTVPCLVQALWLLTAADPVLAQTYPTAPTRLSPARTVVATAVVDRVIIDGQLTNMFLNAFIQYNGREDVWLSNVRFNFIHRPLSDIYVVWNDARESTARNRAFIVKYTHSFAF